MKTGLKETGRRIAVAMTLFALAGAATAQMMDDEEEFHGGRPKKTAEAEAQHKANLKKYKKNKDILVLPGLVADRKEQKVDLLCETTPLEARNSAEYLIVYKDSSHGYEAMIWTYSAPSDIHKALEFIGIRAGAPVNPGGLRFWAKGERITASVVQGEDAVPIERLILDTETETTLPEEGWVFTGSIFIDNPTGGTEKVYLADAYDPRSVIAAYNEPVSVLDPPWTASKGEFYDNHVASPDFDIGANELLTVRLEPQDRNGKPRMRDVSLEVKKDLSFILKDGKDGKQLSAEATFASAVDACKKIIANEQQPYVTVRFDDALTLSRIQPVCTVLVMVDMPGGLQIEPPEKGRLFYRAFLPNRGWLDAANRMAQPWEIHIKAEKGKLSGTMVIHDAEWKSGQSRPDLTKRSFKVKTGKDIQKRLDEEIDKRTKESRRAPPAVLLVYVPSTVVYSKLLEFLNPALETYNTVHLFLDEE